MSEWAEGIFAAFKAWDLRQVAYVPDAGHTWLIDACHRDADIRAVPLTTEEEGVALLAGAWLGGQRGALLMQSSGVGNCINMLSMIRTCRFTLAVLITMRGQWKEFNPWQNPMGGTTSRALETAGVNVDTVSEPDHVTARCEALLQRVYGEGEAAALLLHQRLAPVKTFGEGTPER